MRKKILSNLFIAFLFTIALLHVLMLSLPRAKATYGFYEDMFTGISTAPFKYRVLHGWIVGLLSSLFPLPHAPAISFSASLLSLFSMVVWFLLVRRLFTRLYGDLVALIGVAGLGLMYIVAIWQMGLDNQDFSYSWIEGALFAWALLLLLDWSKRPRFVAYGLLVLIGALNRETGFVSIIWFAFLVWFQDRSRRNTGAIIIYGAIWLGVFIGLRLLLPDTDAYPAPGGGMAYNFAHLGRSLAIMLAVFGIWPLLAWQGGKMAPDILRKAQWGAYLYLALFVFFGHWVEIRIALPVMPIFIGMALAPLKPILQSELA